MDKLYSLNGEDGWTDDPFEIAERLKEDYSIAKYVFIGRQAEPKVGDYLRGLSEIITNHIFELASEDSSEWQENPFEVGEEESKDFDVYIKEKISEFYESKKIKAGWFFIDDIKEIEIKNDPELIKAIEESE